VREGVAFELKGGGCRNRHCPSIAKHLDSWPNSQYGWLRP
jgi:hypothetical protein